ncbi:MAG: cyclic pyranopterin monophosphate synthase MoaC [Clostridiales bacterium]|jgi:cyclic pyranopterin phosphate synthase|nr:cyclic pyranopterin monophosphate synthase MoaC [Clostridiales bacterium]
MNLTHINESGGAVMVDVGSKPVTEREARARAYVRVSPATITLLKSNNVPKGDVLACTRVAGIIAAKKTPELIPLCHTIPLTFAGIDIDVNEDNLEITSVIRCAYKTGAEMEALTAVSVAALTVYDMLKAVDKHIVIDGITLLSKTGGSHG